MLPDTADTQVRHNPAIRARPSLAVMTTLTRAEVPPAEEARPQPARRRLPVALPALLLGTAVLYLWGLGASGWANGYYSAAAQAGSASWKALFFGSFDAGNAITVEKTPASLWLMGLSVRLFGLSPWSILVPEALAGIGAVALLYLTVRRVAGPLAGLLAGAAFAVAPVAVLMFRFNNPDALLVLLLVAAAYAVTRALERASTRWLVLAGALVGFGFLTKMLQAFLVLPAFGVAYFVAAPAPLRRRIGQVLLAAGAMVVAAGWWVAAVALWPAASRPYIGGSQTNSILELTLGYNGFGRLTGSEAGSVGGQNGWGATGLTRLFSAEIGGQVAWLLPAALVLLAAGLWLAGRAPRTDRTRAALLLWGGWLLVTAGTFSFMKGIFHPYYTVALAPGISALAGIGTVGLWRARRTVTDAILAASDSECGSGGGGRPLRRPRRRRPGPVRFRRRHAAGRRLRRPTRRHGWVAQRVHAEQRAGHPADQLQRVPVGRRDGRIEQRGRVPAREPEAGHGDRRFQRQRPVVHPGAVPAIRCPAPDPPLHRRRPRQRRRPRRGEHDRAVGRGERHRDDGRRRHRVRPVLTGPARERRLCWPGAPGPPDHLTTPLLSGAVLYVTPA